MHTLYFIQVDHCCFCWDSNCANRKWGKSFTFKEDNAVTRLVPSSGRWVSVRYFYCSFSVLPSLLYLDFIQIFFQVMSDEHGVNPTGMSKITLFYSFTQTLVLTLINFRVSFTLRNLLWWFGSPARAHQCILQWSDWRKIRSSSNSHGSWAGYNGCSKSWSIWTIIPPR